jgi:hypothetical protein
VAAAAGVFLVASAVIAFKGWPGTGFTDRIDSLFVKDAPPPVAWDKRGTQVAAASAGTAAAAVAGTATGPTFGTPGVILGDNGGAQRGGTVRLPGGTLVSTGPSGPGTVTPATGSGQGGGGALPSLPAPDTSPVQNGAADTVQQTGSALGDTVRQTTGTVGDTVGGPVGDAVTQTGDSVGSTVDNTTKAAGDLLHQP